MEVTIEYHFKFVSTVIYLQTNVNYSCLNSSEFFNQTVDKAVQSDFCLIWLTSLVLLSCMVPSDTSRNCVGIP